MLIAQHSALVRPSKITCKFISAYVYNDNAFHCIIQILSDVCDIGIWHLIPVLFDFIIQLSSV